MVNGDLSCGEMNEDWFGYYGLLTGIFGVGMFKLFASGAGDAGAPIGIAEALVSKLGRLFSRFVRFSAVV